MKPESAWAQFYASRNNEQYYQHVSNKYAIFIQTILSRILPGDRVVEFGCGLCNITRSLYHAIYPKHEAGRTFFVGLDNEIEMLHLSQRNIERAGIPYSKVLFYHGDARRGVLRGDIAHSHGLLEHFQDQDIRAIISHQKGIFRELLHYVPSAKYEKPSFGDERLMTPEQWRKICKPDDIIEFNDGYDLILKWT